MTRELIARCDSPESLHVIGDVIHDCVFSLKNIRFSQATKQVHVPFHGLEGMFESWFTLPWRKRTPGFLLEIKNVNALSFEDQQGIETYNFNTLDYQSESGSLKVITGIPTKVEMIVDGIDLAVFKLAD